MGQLRDGVIKRGHSWSYVIRVTDAAGLWDRKQITSSMRLLAQGSLA